MLTVTLLVKNENVYAHEIISSFRFVDRYAGEIVFSRWNGYSYNDFQPSELKKLNGLLKDITKKGNSVFVDKFLEENKQFVEEANKVTY